jgi:hypothetical protein
MPDVGVDGKSIKDSKKVSSNPMDIMKNLNKDITKVSRKKK